MRPASFCAGCPHRGIYHEISKYNGKIVATGDIGCYALNINIFPIPCRCAPGPPRRVRICAAKFYTGEYWNFHPDMV